MLSKLYGYLLGALGLVVAALAALGMAKREGKKEAQSEATEKALEQAKEAIDISQANRNLSDADLDAKLRRDRRD